MRDQAAYRALGEACLGDGCFYLDLSSTSLSHESSQVIGMASKVLQTAKNFFDYLLEDKMSFEMDSWMDMHIGGCVRHDPIGARNVG